MINPIDLYRKIESSKLTEEGKHDLHDWYREKHIKTTRISLWLLSKVKQWREWKLSKLQEKVLRRLK